MEKIKCLIIDDDPFIRDLLKDKLSQFLQEVQVVDTANSGEEGIRAIQKHQPDLIFLDVEMADMTGFQMLSQLSSIHFQTIFITSYSHYAIKAIRFNALDYLVKPIDLGELKDAIERYHKRKTKKDPQENIKQALQNFETEDTGMQELTLTTQEGTLHIAVHLIVRIEGDRNYSNLIIADGKKKLLSKTVGDLEELLSDKGFFRCHKSHLVNFRHIVAEPGKLIVEMGDGEKIPIARRRKEAFIEWWRQQSG